MPAPLHSDQRSVDVVDLAQFERLGAAWWDERGAMAALHRINPLRLRYIRDRAAAQFGPTVGGNTDRATLPLANLSVLDIGCGGGLLAEPLARLGARVTGIDPGRNNITAASRHAADGGVAVDYRATTLERVARDDGRFDIVIASEVVEHVVDPAAFTAMAAGLVKPRGLLLVSTLNRTAKSYLLAIVAAEYVLGWLPRGTHDWKRFVRPDELARAVRPAGLVEVDRSGMIYDPLRDAWRLGRDTDVNYWFSAARPG